MPPIPDWLAQQLQQFPVVALVVGVAAVVVRWLEARHRRDLDRTRADAAEDRRRADADVAQARQDRDEATRHHAAEIGRLTKLYDGQLAAARRRVRELERHLPGTER